MNISSNLKSIGTMRLMLLGLIGLGLLGTGVELLLLEHFEDYWQMIPLFVVGLCLIVLCWSANAGSARSLRIFQASMLIMIASGFLGLYLHYDANREFELEMYPSLRGSQLFWEAIRGATPALVPGMMVELGLLGLVYTYKHPAIPNDKNRSNNQEV